MPSRDDVLPAKKQMSDKFFLDTNILIYSLDKRVPAKQDVALKLVKRAKAEGGCISMQVAQECISLLTTKFQYLMAIKDVRHYLEMVLAPIAEPLEMMPLYRNALSLQERWKFRFYDALIVAAALTLECSQLYSEDFQHGQRIEGLTVVNPFI